MNQSVVEHYFLLKILAIGLIILGVRLWLIKIASVSIPYADDWEIALFINDWFNGNTNFLDLIRPYSEHPIALTRIITLSLISLNGQWDTRIEMVVNSFIFTSTIILFQLIIKKSIGEKYENLILLTVAVIAIPPYSWLNVLWGFQSAWYLLFFLTIMTFWGLLMSQNFSFKWWIGCSSGLISCCNLGSGFFALLIVMLFKFILILNRSEKIWHNSVTFVYSAILVGFSATQLFYAPKFSTLYSRSILEFFESFGRFMSWPWIEFPFLCLLIYFPFVLLILLTVSSRRLPSSKQLVVFAIGFWVVFQAFGMAFARGAGDGAHSVSRYWELLSFGVVVNFLSLILIKKVEHKLIQNYRKHINTFTCVWGLFLSIGLTNLLINSVPDIKNFHHQKSSLLMNIRSFFLTGEEQNLKSQTNYPYPTKILIDYFKASPEFKNILSHEVSTPTLLRNNDKNTAGKKYSSFVKNGFEDRLVKFKGENVLGSLNHKGSSAIARFESYPINIKNKYIEIPFIGSKYKKDFKFYLVTEEKMVPVKLDSNVIKKQWVSTFTRTPKKPFKILALDESETDWFAFAMPRGVGVLSYYGIKLVNLGIYLVMVGFFLIITFLIIEQKFPKKRF